MENNQFYRNKSEMCNANVAHGEGDVIQGCCRILLVLNRIVTNSRNGFSEITATGCLLTSKYTMYDYLW